MKALIVSVFVCCLVVAGCGGGSDTSSPPSQTATLASLRITTSSSVVPIGGIQSLTATGTYSDGRTQNLTDEVTWSSAAENIATVNVHGEVTGASIGTVMITAVSGSAQAGITLTVGPPALADIDISPWSPSTPANTTLQLIAMGRYTDGKVREVSELASWKSSDEAKVTVSATGLATGHSIGTATVTARVGNITDSKTMTVSSAHLTRMAVLPYQPVAGVGVTQRFTALGEFDDSSRHELASLTWSSSNSAVATITGDGLATPLHSGSATIVAKSGTISSSTVLTVLPATLATIMVSPANALLSVGTDQQFSAQGLLTDGSLVELPVVTWASRDGNVAAVDGGGRASAALPGTTLIQASLAGITGSSTLQVAGTELQSVVIAPALPSVPFRAGAQPSCRKQLYAIGIFSDGASQDLTEIVTWWSSDSRVATVDKSGLVSVRAIGSATISASLGTVHAATSIQVSSTTVESVTVEPANSVVAVGTKSQYLLTSNLSDGTSAVLDAPLWNTGPVNKLTSARDGLVTARSPGSGKVYGDNCCVSSFAALTISYARAQKLDIQAPSPNVPGGAVQQLKAVATFDDGSSQDVSNAVHWTSSQPSVALVDSNGIVTAIAQGTTTITATFGPIDGSPETVTGEATLSVLAVQFTGLTVNPAYASLSLGQSQSFSALGTFSDQSQHAVAGLVWRSSNPAVAIVLPNGVVISSGRGTTSITATSAGIEASATVTVQ